jgi:hypothetical protein
METFVLVVRLWLVGEPWSWDYREARTPGLGLEEMQSRGATGAATDGADHCFLEGAPAPAWTRPPDANPPGACAACGVIPGRRPA